MHNVPSLIGTAEKTTLQQVDRLTPGIRRGECTPPWPWPWHGTACVDIESVRLLCREEVEKGSFDAGKANLSRFVSVK